MTSVISIYRRFPTKESCLEHLEKVRWKDEPCCPYCKSEKVSKKAEKEQRDRWQCSLCRKSFSVTVGTIFHNSHVDLQRWFLLISLMFSAKKGLSAMQAARDLEMRRPTVWSMMHRIRAAMVDDGRFLAGVVEKAMTTQQTVSLNYRQKTLVGLLSAFGGHLPNTDFQKYLFLFTQEFEKEPSFEFVPYKFGSFSFQSYADKRRLIEVGALAESDDWQLQEGFLAKSLFDEAAFNRCYDKYSRLKGRKLVQEVYRRYPYFAINSEIADEIMNEQEIGAITAARPADEAPCFFTIGYEGSSFEGYLNRIIKNNVKTLVDVRRNPLSRKYGFSKKTLADTVKKLDINYVHIPELGIASERRQELNTQADYDRLFDSYEKQELKRNGAALKSLFDIFQKDKRVAITCFEAHVCMCHRGRVARAISALPGWKYDIRHI